MTSQVRNLRIVQGAFVVYAIGLFLFMGRLHSSTGQEPSSQFVWAIFAVAIIDLALGIFLRAKVVGKSRSMDAPYKQRLQAWFSGNLVGLAFSFSTCLFGLVLHVMGGSKRMVQVLFGLGIVMLIMQSPGAPPEQQPNPTV